MELFLDCNNSPDYKDHRYNLPACFLKFRNKCKKIRRSVAKNLTLQKLETFHVLINVLLLNLFFLLSHCRIAGHISGKE